jgi:O-antigen ligase
MLTTQMNFQFKQIYEWLSASWILLLFVPLVFFIPQPATQFGHPWKVELFSSVLLLGFVLISKKFFDNFKFDSINILLISLVIWSGLSLFWADSSRSVAHHTLVWTIYFFLFLHFRNIVENKDLLKKNLIVLNFYVWIICLACLTEYFLFDSTTAIFRHRYASISEILILVFPIYFILTLFSKGKTQLFNFLTCLLIWSAIIASATRTSVICLTFSIFLLSFILIVKEKSIRLIPKIAILILLISLPTIFTSFFRTNDEASVYNRFNTEIQNKSGNNENISMRLFLWKVVSFEMLKENPIQGVGADNFGLAFNNSRKNYAQTYPTDTHLSAIESYMPERTHNEYLQILAELGLVGFGIISMFFIFSGKTFITNLKNSKTDIYFKLKIGAFIGLISFLISSFVSSFSFRAMQNALVFFFILAIALSNKTKEKKEVKALQSNFSWKPILVGFAILTCVSLFTLTSSQILGNYYLSLADEEKDLEIALPIYQKAVDFNSDNAVAHFSIGLRYYVDKKPDQAIPFMKEGIKKGFDINLAHFYLASTQKYAGFVKEATETTENALKIYPRSLFLRTYHADLLKKIGENEKAQTELEIAKNINEKDAEVWTSLITIGAEYTTYKIRDDKSLPALMDLSPFSGVKAINDEQKLFNPKGTNMANIFKQNQ